jgi:hypothetical protein
MTASILLYIHKESAIKQDLPEVFLQFRNDKEQNIIKIMHRTAHSAQCVP